MFTKTQREHYNHDRDITCERLGITKNTYNAFRRMGQALHQEYENQCNGFESTADERDSEVREEQLNNQARDLAKQYGLFIFFQTDPRGATIYLSKEPIPYNDYNRAAQCIY
jgi:hypothetical protein